MASRTLMERRRRFVTALNDWREWFTRRPHAISSRPIAAFVIGHSHVQPCTGTSDRTDNFVRPYITFNLFSAGESRKPSLEVAPTTTVTFASCVRELWPTTQMNQNAKYPGQRSLCSKVTVLTLRHTHTGPIAPSGLLPFWWIKMNIKWSIIIVPIIYE